MRAHVMRAIDRLRVDLSEKYPGCELAPVDYDSSKCIVRKADGSVWEMEWLTTKAWNETRLFAPMEEAIK